MAVTRRWTAGRWVEVGDAEVLPGPFVVGSPAAQRRSPMVVVVVRGAGTHGLLLLLTMRKPWREGTTGFVFSAMELTEKPYGPTPLQVASDQTEAWAFAPTGGPSDRALE